MSSHDRLGTLGGGTDTTRLSAAEQDRLHREQRQADALSYLQRRGVDDEIAQMLGLVPYEAKPTHLRVGREVTR